MPARVRTPQVAARTGARRVGVSSRVQVSEIQRSRLLAAAVRTIEELGYTRATVAHITHRARVSRRTFYELFSNREDCLVAVLESVVESVKREIAHAGLDGLPWRELVRGGLLAILSFFDREPALARVYVVQSLRGGQGVLERREEILRALAGVVDEGRRSEGARRGECPPLTAEGLVGAAFAIVYARVLRDEREPLTGLLGELMGMIVLPYLGPAAARRETDRPVPVLVAGVAAARDGRDAARAAEGDPLQGVPMRLTYRTARVLETIADAPGVSNRLVGERAGVTDQGQISKLLARLERLGLTQNTGEGHAKGEPNAWTLTATGQRVAQCIRAHTTPEREGVLS
jgi:AcrR family transcriptional regulator